MRTPLFAVAILGLVTPTFLLSQGCGTRQPASDTVPASVISRGFYMGITDNQSTPNTPNETWQRIKENGDLVIFFDDAGIPWQKAYDQDFANYPADYLANIADQIARLQALPKRPEVFVYINLLDGERTALAKFRVNGGTTHPAPAPWDTKTTAFNDSMVVTAFTNHCKYLISRLNPKYLSLGIEANMMLDSVQLGNTPMSAWTNYVAGVQSISSALKAAHPNVELLVSLQLGSYYKNRAYQEPKILPLIQATDIIAVTSYPYMDYNKIDDLPNDYFSSIADLAPGKPFAIAEQGWPAENIFYPDPLPSSTPPSINIAFTADDQVKYYEKVLNFALKRQTAFVGVWITQDGDGYWTQLFQYWPEPIRMLSRFFRDIGFYDGAGNARASLQTWQKYFQYPKH